MQWIVADGRQRSKGVGEAVISGVTREGCESLVFLVLTQVVLDQG